MYYRDLLGEVVLDNMQLRMEMCDGCGLVRPIVNNKHCLCNECNWKRLHPQEEAKTYQLKRTPLKPSTTPLKRSNIPLRQRSKKAPNTLKLDEQVYEQVYLKAIQNHTCECENCNVALDPRFRDEEGRVVQRFRYSHILTKGAFPEHRYNVLNFNFLCYNCHQIWEFGGNKGRIQMKIFVKNEKTAQILLESKHSKSDS